MKNIDYPFTSKDVGDRKPHAEGLKFLVEKMQIDMKEITYINIDGMRQYIQILCSKQGNYGVCLWIIPNCIVIR